jgi:ABC-type bacteriocin/lantibiotic exporter with double-glycine peptidase domain
VGYFQCHLFCKSMMCFVAMLCVMCVLMVLVHLIISYSMTLTYFVASYITQSSMFNGASAFNQNLCNWEVKSGAYVYSFCTGAISCGGCSWY